MSRSGGLCCGDSCRCSRCSGRFCCGRSYSRLLSIWFLSKNQIPILIKWYFLTDYGFFSSIKQILIGIVIGSIPAGTIIGEYKGKQQLTLMHSFRYWEGNSSIWISDLNIINGSFVMNQPGNFCIGIVTVHLCLISVTSHHNIWRLITSIQHLGKIHVIAIRKVVDHSCRPCRMIG